MNIINYILGKESNRMAISSDLMKEALEEYELSTLLEECDAVIFAEDAYSYNESTIAGYVYFDKANRGPDGAVIRTSKVVTEMNHSVEGVRVVGTMNSVYLVIGKNQIVGH